MPLLLPPRSNFESNVWQVIVKRSRIIYEEQPREVWDSIALAVFPRYETKLTQPIRSGIVYLQRG